MSAIPFASPIDLNNLEIQNFTFQNLTGTPTGVIGKPIIDTSDGNKLKYYNGSTWVTLDGGGGITDLTGDVTASGTGSVAATVAFVGGASAANVADAVTKRHTQHTDTGTTQTSFQIDSGNTGPRLKNSSGEIQVRNAADSADANLKAANIAATGDVTITGNLTVNGTTTTLNVTTVETGDNIILLNGEIATSAGNTNGGISVKRLHTDNSTRRDVSMIWDETLNRWTADTSPDTSAVRTHVVAMKYSELIGDNSATSFVVTHNLNSTDVTVSIREVATGTNWITDLEYTSADTVTVRFATAPTSDQFNITVIG